MRRCASLLHVLISAVALSAGPLEQRSGSATARNTDKQPPFLQATVLGQKSPELPQSIIRILTANYRGWRIPTLSSDVMSSWQTAFAEATPNVLRGDYDGNGEFDVAVLVVYPVTAADGRSTRWSRALAFLQTSGVFQLHALTRPLPFDDADGLHLWPVTKGEKGWDLNTADAAEFIYERDAIAVRPSASGPCATFICRGGRFVSIWTCD